MEHSASAAADDAAMFATMMMTAATEDRGEMDLLLREEEYKSLSPRSRRKRRNRDQMRIARQRERETMERLRVSVERLELQYNALQRQQQQRQQHETDTADSDRREAYAKLLTYSSQLKEENFYLKTSLCEKQKLKETLERITNDFVSSAGTLSGQEAALKQDDMAPDNNDVRLGPSCTRRDSKRRARPTRQYSEEDAWALITDTHQQIARIQALISHAHRDTSQSVAVVSPSGGSSDDHAASSSSPESPLSDPTLRSPSPPFFGWSIRHHTHLDSGRLLMCFEKAFPHVSAYQSMVRMWQNERAMMTYRDAKHAAMQSMQIAHTFNDDTYVFERTVRDPVAGRCVTSSYLRWRAQKIARQVGAGYLIGTRSIDIDAERSDHDDGAASSLWASQLCLSTEFRPIVGNAGCFVRITGATNLTHADDAQQNVAEAIIGLLRWENETIGPLFTLRAA